MPQRQEHRFRNYSHSMSATEVAINEVDEQPDASVLWQSETARKVSNRKRTSVLLGCAILVSLPIAMDKQLPIWGFAMTYGIVQEYYTNHWTFAGSQSAVGVIGTTSNGVIYLSMPFLFAFFSRRWAHYRRKSAICGAVLMAIGFLLASFSTHVWHLVVTQGIIVALGCVMMYSPTTLSLSECFSANNRAIAYGVVLSAKNITGSACPFLMQFLLERYGYRNTMRIWMAIATSTSLVAVFFMPMDRPGTTSTSAATTKTSRSSPRLSIGKVTSYRSRRVPWDFLHHRTIYVYSLAIIFQSSGYGITQTYLNSYAQSVASLSATSSTLLLTLFNAPGIVSSSFFGFLADNKRVELSADVMTFISAFVAAGAALGLWGLAPGETEGGGGRGMVLLVLFSIIYGAFAGGYSATWGAVVKEMERDARGRNEALDTGLVYGFLNGARGVGFVGGGLVGVRLLKVGGDGGWVERGRFAYNTVYGPLILFTGLSTLVGGWSLGLRAGRLLRWM